MELKKTTLILFCFLFLSISADAQNIIKGAVKDAETGKPLPGVNVYLSNTTIGSGTNSVGSYEINTDETGRFELVFSYIGYKSKVAHITIKPGSTIIANTVLKPATYTIDEIEVKGSNKEWKNNFEQFKNAFVGTSQFAQQTTITNPTILEFSEPEKDRLMATAPAPLKLTNKALGYSHYIELVEFDFNRTGAGRYLIYSRYKELEATDKDQKEQWERNRIKAYLGSMQHFLKCLYRGTLKEDHFSLLHKKNIIRMSDTEMQYELMQRGQLATGIQSQVKGFLVDDKVRVTYEHTRLTPWGDIVVYKRSAIEANTDSGIFIVHKAGKLLNPTSLMVFGNWARSRVAESLPDNYEIDN